MEWLALPCLTFEFGVWALLLGLGCILGLAKCPLPIYPSMALVIKTNLILNFVFFFFLYKQEVSKLNHEGIVMLV
jgi:hypothetical protein